QADAVPVCIATPMADVVSTKPRHMRVTPARSVLSFAMDGVARMLETIHLSQHGPMLRADTCTPNERIASTGPGLAPGKSFQQSIMSPGLPAFVWRRRCNQLPLVDLLRGRPARSGLREEINRRCPPCPALP